MAAAPRKRRSGQGKSSKTKSQSDVLDKSVASSAPSNVPLSKPKSAKVSNAANAPAKGVPTVPPSTRRQNSNIDGQKSQRQGPATSLDIERSALEVSKCTTNVHQNNNKPQRKDAGLATRADTNELPRLSKSQRRRNKKFNREKSAPGRSEQPTGSKDPKNKSAITNKRTAQKKQPWRPIAAWKRLPCELTLQILKWTLISPNTSIPLPVGLEWRAQPSLRNYKVNGKHVCPDVNMVWISKAFYRDCLRTYYGQNTWCLGMSDYFNYRETIRQWPHDCVPTARDCVQYLHICKDLWEAQWWNFFPRLATFTALRELTFDLRDRGESGLCVAVGQGVTMDAPDEFKLELEACTKFTTIRLQDFVCIVCQSGQEHLCKDKCLQVKICGDSKDDVQHFTDKMWNMGRAAASSPLAEEGFTNPPDMDLRITGIDEEMEDLQL